MPHYWFRIPLSSTADHLKRAKERGGAPAVKRAIDADAIGKGKAAKKVLFDPRMNWCYALLYSRDPLTPDECNELKELWDIDRASPCSMLLEADETVLEEAEEWIASEPDESGPYQAQ